MYLNLKESADLLSCSTRKIGRLKATGAITPVKRGNANYYLKDDLLAIAPDVIQAKKHTTKKNKTVKQTEPPKMPPFEITPEVQKQFDNIIKIVESHSADLNALDDLVESLLLLRHYKTFYHEQVQKNPLDQNATKLLSQAIRDEIAILKALKVSP